MNLAPVLIRGGGDLASGVALRLRRAGFKIVITELPRPLAVRRTVSFSEAVFDGAMRIEDRTGRRSTPQQLRNVLRHGEIAVVVDPEARLLLDGEYSVVVDARMRKAAPETLPRRVPLLIGLGPGFLPGENCDAAIETQRGHYLGRVYWAGSAQVDSGIPDGDPDRVLRAPRRGVLRDAAEIGAHAEAGDVLARVEPGGAEPKQDIRAPLTGVVRGMLRSGSDVETGMKVGDVDVRDDARLCFLVSDKSLAVAGGVLEAILAELGKRHLPRDRD